VSTWRECLQQNCWLIEKKQHKIPSTEIWFEGAKVRRRTTTRLAWMWWVVMGCRRSETGPWGRFLSLLFFSLC
jgi:hypothetical protein